jgi:hypothetical protein
MITKKHYFRNSNSELVLTFYNVAPNGAILNKGLIIATIIMLLMEQFHSFGEAILW